MPGSWPRTRGVVVSLRCGRGWGVAEESGPLGVKIRARQLPTWAPYAVLLVVAGASLLLFFNRFAALRSGDGEYTGGLAFLRGVLPYRDYYTTAPPWNVLKSALLLRIFGQALVVSRAAGVVERLLLAAVLFRWLRQIVAPMPALVGALVTAIVSAGDRTDPVASYNHDAILWAMLSGLVASSVLRRVQGGARVWRLAAISGACAAMSLLTKQTVGLGALTSVLAVPAVLLGSERRPRDVGRWLLGYVAGGAVPLGLVAAVLGRLGLLRPMLRMLFVEGPAAKATHASDFLLRELLVAWDNFGWLTLGGFTLALAWGALRRFGRAGEASEDKASEIGRGERITALWVLASGLGVLALAEAMQALPALHDFSKSAVYFTVLGLSGLLVSFAAEAWRERVPLTPRRAQIVLFATVSWAVAATLSLSWPAFEAMVVPGLGLLVAAVVEQTWRRSSAPWVYAALALTSLMQVREKLDLPFGFDYQDEGAVRSATVASVEPQLRGMRLPEATTHFLDETLRTIRDNTRPGDTIFVYPEMGLLYALSGRGYPTLSGSHNVDVVSDAMAAAEADRVRRAPPAVIVYYRLTEEQQRGAERLWRRGHPSGQRLLVTAVEDLIRGYRLAGRFELRSGDPEILVYVRQGLNLSGVQR